MNSRAAVVRLTFLGGGRESLGDVLGKGSSGGTDLLHCPKGVAGIDGLLGHLYSDGGSAGNLVGQGLGGFDYLRPGRQLVGDAPGQGTFRCERLTGEDQLLGSSGADEIAEPSVAAPAGEGAYAHLCQTEHGILGDDPQIGRQRQLEAPAICVAGDGGNGRLPESGEAVEHPVPQAGPVCPHVERLQRLEAFDVGAGTERTLPYCGEQDDSHVSVRIEGGQDLLALLQHLRSERIVLVGPVQDDRADLPVRLQPDPAYVRLLELAHVGPSLASGWLRPRSTWWTPFSPIMVEVAMVLPLINLGMIEASITRSPSMPRTLSSSSTTARSSSPILQEPTGW